jgi:ParB family chromosome partitioning protein
MSANKNRLGRGLEKLLSSTESKADTSIISSTIGKVSPIAFSGKTIVSVSVGDITPNPRQPRQKFDENSLKDLAASIKTYGIIQPLIVRKKDGNKYELVAGERRLRAAKIAGLEKIPVIIRDMSDAVSLEQAITENVQREDLNILEEAVSYALLMKEFNLTQEEVSNRVGKARSSIANTLRLNELPREVKDSLLKNEITAGHARAILSAGDVMEQLRLWGKIVKENMNVREAEKAVSNKKTEKAIKSEKSTQLSRIEQEFSSKLMAKVELSGTEQKGVISIKYASKDDLDRLYSLIVHGEVI